MSIFRWNKTVPAKSEIKITIEEALSKYPDKVETLSVPGKPKDPPPDLSTKPDDIIGYCFGYVCPKKHVGETFESITMDGYKVRKVCGVCGRVSKPATVKRAAEAKWEDHGGYYRHSEMRDPAWKWSHKKPGYGWYIPNTRWTELTLVQFLDTPVRKK